MDGARIGITAARRAHEQSQLVTALGGIPVVGSSIGCDEPADDTGVGAQIASALAGPVDLVIAMTGIGGHHTLAVATRTGHEEALRAALGGATVVARGTKARNRLRRLDIRVDRVAEPPSSSGLVAMLDDIAVAGRRAVVICSGPADDPIVAALRERGADVVTIHPYAIDLPDVAEPALDLARATVDGRLDAITFTSANAVDGLAAICARAGLDEIEPHASVLVTAVGPVTRQALIAHGWRVDVEPATPRMGAMYQSLAAALRARAAGGHSTTPGSRSTD